VLLNLNLLGQYVVSYLSTLAEVRSFAKHTLKSDDPNSEVVHCNPMILSAHNFRRHIPWRATCVLLIIRCPDTSNSKVCKTKISIILKDQILRLHISMDDPLVMDVLQRENKASNEELHLFLAESSVF